MVRRNPNYILNFVFHSKFVLVFFIRYKNNTRIEEVKLLLQGIQLPEAHLCSQTTLPSANERPTQLILPVNPATFEEPVDTTGQANVRRRLEILPSPICGDVVDAGSSVELQSNQPGLLSSTPPMSRTTMWRKRKAAGTINTLYCCLFFKF